MQRLLLPLGLLIGAGVALGGCVMAPAYPTGSPALARPSWIAGASCQDSSPTAPTRRSVSASQAAIAPGSDATFASFATFRVSSTTHTDACFRETSRPAYYPTAVLFAHKPADLATRTRLGGPRGNLVPRRPPTTPITPSLERPKLTAVAHVHPYLILGSVPGLGPDQGSPDFMPAMRRAAGLLPLDTTLTDAAWDAEHNHRLCREDLGVPRHDQPVEPAERRAACAGASGACSTADASTPRAASAGRGPRRALLPPLGHGYA
jgi:hypothetical protein